MKNRLIRVILSLITGCSLLFATATPAGAVAEHETPRAKNEQVIAGVPGKIFFVSTRNGNAQIYSMEPDGNNQTRISSNTYNDLYPDVSPDGSTIAFLTNRATGSATYENLDVFLMNIDGSNVTQLTNLGHCYNAVWSPDGAKIAFNTWDFVNREGAIYTMNADGANLSAIPGTTFDDGHPSWSPDGRKIVFTSGGYIFTMNIDGTDRVRLTNPTGTSGWDDYSHPVWSPDGTRITYIFVHYTETPGYVDHNGVYTMNADGSNQTRIGLSGYDGSPAWSPDSRKIVLPAYLPHNIYVIDADGANPVALTNATQEPDANYDPCWAASLAPVPPTPPAPILKSPVSGALLTSLTPRLEWNPSTGAVSYNIQIAPDATFASVSYAAGAGLFLDVLPGWLETGKTYYWRVAAYNSTGGSSDWSSGWAFITPLLPPPPPVLKLPANGNTINTLAPTLEWNLSQGATGYTLQLSGASNFGSLIVNETGLTSLSYTIPPAKELDHGRMYYWRVNTFSGGGTSAWSTPWSFTTDSNLIKRPANVLGTIKKDTRGRYYVRLTWQDNSDNEDGFLFEKAYATTGPWNQFGAASANGYYYDDSYVRAGDACYYRIRAWGHSRYSGYSDVAIVAIPPTAPVPVFPINDAIVQNLQPEFRWNPSPSATGYHLQVAQGGVFTNLVINETGIPNPYYTPALKLDSSVQYFWRVRAYNGAFSDFSYAAYFRTPSGPPPRAPSDLTATPVSSGRIVLAWRDNSNTTVEPKIEEEGFQIERTTNPAIGYSYLATVGPNVTTFTDAGLAPGATYFYRVKAYKGTTASGYSNEVDAHTWPAGKFVYASSLDGDPEIYVFDTVSATGIKLTNNAAEDTQPVYSPDGSKIAFTSNRDGNREIYVMNADGSDQARLTASAAADEEPAWLPDGNKIIFTSNRDGNPEIYIMNIDGSYQNRITNNTVPDGHPDWPMK